MVLLRNLLAKRPALQRCKMVNVIKIHVAPKAFEVPNFAVHVEKNINNYDEQLVHQNGENCNVKEEELKKIKLNAYLHLPCLLWTKQKKRHGVDVESWCERKPANSVPLQTNYRYFCAKASALCFKLVLESHDYLHKTVFCCHGHCGKYIF